MSDEKVLTLDALHTLPPEWPEELLPGIREEIGKSKYKLVVLDDDPTGTQTVRDIPVLTHWSVDGLRDELKSDYPAFFILTNSRSLPKDQACSLAREVGVNIKEASEGTGVRAIVISRSDSTLRGHFPVEVDATAKSLGKKNLPYLLIPFFLEGGRYTIGDVHYVREGTTLIPAAQTPFARDAAFGFSQSNLKKYIEEKTSGAIPAEKVVSISLEDIRIGGPKLVAEILKSVPHTSACCVNAVSYRDMEVLVTALLHVENDGYEFLYRTAASFVRTRTGLDENAGLLTGAELINGSNHGGLFVIGSYVPKTTSQVSALLEQTDVVPIEVNVSSLLTTGKKDEEVKRVVRESTEMLESGRDAAIYTSRELVTGKNATESLKIGDAISRSLVEIVSELPIKPRYLVAKGGITSSDVATKALNIRRAMVIGQALPGVPAWRLGGETPYPGMTYIVFPGNVGDDDALVQLQRNLK